MKLLSTRYITNFHFSVERIDLVKNALYYKSLGKFENYNMESGNGKYHELNKCQFYKENKWNMTSQLVTEEEARCVCLEHLYDTKSKGDSHEGDSDVLMLEEAMGKVLNKNKELNMEIVKMKDQTEVLIGKINEGLQANEILKSRIKALISDLMRLVN
jgi:hypothetical protein